MTHAWEILIMKARMIVLVLLAMCGPSYAGSDGDLQVTWSTLDGGGAVMTGGAVSLSGTIGQPDAGPGSAGMAGGDYGITGGFWAFGALQPAGPCVAGTGDMDGDGDLDTQDYSAWAACFAGPAITITVDCSCADLDGDDDTDLLDFAEFQALFMGSAP
jgi:hypothetical protein